MRTEDGQIIHKCLNGEPEAFGFLVDKYKESVYAFAYTKLRNFHDAEDVTQEVFINAYRKLRTLRRWDSFLAWLYHITSNLCRMWIRSRSRRPDSEFIEDKDQDTLEKLSLDSYLESRTRNSLHESLQEAMDSLPEMHRQVLTLHYLGGMSCQEMARFLGASPTAIWQRLSRARSQLREEMLAMMNTTFESQKLQGGFTLRIVETVKRIKIHPIPRAAGLPWGLSLAAGVIIATLSMNPHLSMINPQGFPSSSPLSVETRVLKTGEIPVEVLKISQTLAIASRQGDGDGGEVRPSDERGAFLLAPQASEVKLLPRDGAAGDLFGYSVSIHGDYAIVGAFNKDDANEGFAYIFKRDGSSWKEQVMLFAEDGKNGDRFGYAVAISDEFAVVGAPFDDDKGEHTGSVYVFRRTGESWVQQAKFTPHGQAILWCAFGVSVAISGDYIVVGSHGEENTAGAIYIFKLDGDKWNEQSKLIPSNRAKDNQFGYAVSISGDYVIATAPLRGNFTGSAYIFKRNGDIWKEQAILTANDGKAKLQFGRSASIYGDYAIVGAGGPGDEFTGTAYIFVRDDNSWRQQAKIIPDDLTKGDNFSSAACIYGDYAIVGASESGGYKGSIYGFIREGDSWKQVSKQVASDGRSEDVFGRAAAFSGNYAIIGACGADVNGEDSGAAYIYSFADFFPVEPSGSSSTTFGREKDKPELPDVAIPPPAKQSIPMNFRLLQNFPNPFNPETWLPYELASDADVTIWIYNSSGELVRRLNPGRQEAGFYTTRDRAACWDGRNEAGEQVSSGTYFYTIRAGEFTATRKMAIAE